MTGVFKTVTFMVLVFAAAAVVVFAEDYDVGGDMEWTRPKELEYYTTWAAGKTFRVGDELEFEFAPERHDVAVVSQAAYENCEKEKPISLMTIPPVKIILNTTGPQYFICTIADHCRFGQKLAINVVGAGGAATPATPGTGPGNGTGPGAGAGTGPGTGGTTAPTTPGTTTPSGSTGTTTTTTTPAGNAASSIGGASFVVALVSAVMALF